jgi:hypothetical protein
MRDLFGTIFLDEQNDNLQHGTEGFRSPHDWITRTQPLVKDGTTGTARLGWSAVVQEGIVSIKPCAVLQRDAQCTSEWVPDYIDALFSGPPRTVPLAV